MKTNQLPGSPPSESVWLEKCLQSIEQKAGWGDCHQWTQCNFERLSEHIHAESAISISSSTLRRLFDQYKAHIFHRHPQIATKNALAIYLGYTDWDGFVKQSAAHGSATEQRISRYSAIWEHSKRKWWIFFLIAGVSLSAVSLIYRIHNRLTDAPRAVLTKRAINPDSSLVAFDYNVSGVKTDSIFLDFGDGTSSWLPKGIKSITHEYAEPNMYQATLVSQNRPLASVTVPIISQGWVAAIAQRGFFYTAKESVSNSGALYLSPQSVQRSRADTATLYWTFYRNVRNFDVIGDSFSAEMRVRNSKPDGGISCYDVNLTVSGESGSIRLEFMEPGCTVWADLVAGNVKLDGKVTDLSAFGQDFSRWKDVAVQVKKQRLTVSVEGKPIYSLTYQQPIGAIKAVTVGFKGSGSVDHFRLYNATGRLAYSDDFDN